MPSYDTGDSGPLQDCPEGGTYQYSDHSCNYVSPHITEFCDPQIDFASSAEVECGPDSTWGYIVDFGGVSCHYDRGGELAGVYFPRYEVGCLCEGQIASLLRAGVSEGTCYEGTAYVPPDYPADENDPRGCGLSLVPGSFGLHLVLLTLLLYTSRSRRAP